MRLFHLLIAFIILYSLNVFSQVFEFFPDEKLKPILDSVQVSEESKTFLLNEIEHLNQSGTYGEWVVELKQVESLPNGQLAQIVPKSNPGEPFKVILSMTEEAIKNPLIVTEQMILLDQIFGKSHYSNLLRKPFISPLHWGETVLNANLGSASARKKLAAVRLEAYLQMPTVMKEMNYKNERIFPAIQGIDEDSIKSYIDQRIAEFQAQYDQALKLEKSSMKEAKKKWNLQREKFPALEAQTEKLNDLISKNDRAGVKKLLEDYLPWPLMDPVEQAMWRQWLSAIENPDLGEKRLIFRGVDEDSIPLNKEGKPFQMSTVLTKNQGNYNRRLRSLQTMREKFGTNHLLSPMIPVIPNYEHGSSLSLMMRNHGDDPKGSPFLSASQHDVAARFGHKKRFALLINENRLVRNINSKYISEKEILIPLIIFPDEVVHYENLFGTDQFIEGDHFIQQVESKLGRTVELDERYFHHSPNQDFVQKGLDEMNSQIFSNTHLSGCLLESSTSCHCSLNSLSQLLK